jgi:Na+/H+-dicarboxylate symporter
MIFSLPAQLLAVIAFVIFFGQYLPLNVIEASFTFSEAFKELLALILPFMVFFFVLSGILSFKKNAPAVLSVMLGTIFLSNGFVALLSFIVMNILAPTISCERLGVSFKPVHQVTSGFSLSLPFSLSAVHALIAAIAIGLLGSFVALGIDSAVTKGKNFIETVLQKIFIPALPLYVLGFLLKIRYEGQFSCLMRQYGSAFILIVSMQFVYLVWMYLLACGFDPKKSIIAFKNAFPSYLTAFSTMSSTATVPVAVKAATENTGNRPLADVAMPIMANVHLLGDSISTPVLAMVTMLIFHGALPAFTNYMMFVFYFCFTMFAASGIPGGGILVMIPILKSQLGFNPEMISIVLTLYFLLDPFGTAANVMGDGALVIIVNRILRRLGIA